MKHKNIILSSITLMGSILVIPVSAAVDEAAVTLDEMSVIGTREAQSINETALSIGVVKSEDIENIKPSHPSEIMRLVPGVHVNVTGGEGHMTAIRQPITTKAVYLILKMVYQHVQQVSLITMQCMKLMFHKLSVLKY